MAQPNLTLLSQNFQDVSQNFQDAARVFQGASHEIGLLENLPPVHDRQAIDNNHRELVRLIETLTTRFTRFEERVEERLTRVEERLTRVEERLDHLSTRSMANDHNQRARSLNASANYVHIPLVQLRTPDNRDVEEFPDTLPALGGLNGAQLERLLRIFDLPTTGNLDVKRRRFQGFIGVPTQV